MYHTGRTIIITLFDVLEGVLKNVIYSKTTTPTHVPLTDIGREKIQKSKILPDNPPHQEKKRDHTGQQQRNRDSQNNDLDLHHRETHHAKFVPRIFHEGRKPVLLKHLSLHVYRLLLFLFSFRFEIQNVRVHYNFCRPGRDCVGLNLDVRISLMD